MSYGSEIELKVSSPAEGSGAGTALCIRAIGHGRAAHDGSEALKGHQGRKKGGY